MIEGVVDLSPTARAALAELVKLLSEGYTGTVELECNEGGVRRLRVSHNLPLPKLLRDTG